MKLTSERIERREFQGVDVQTFTLPSASMLESDQVQLSFFSGAVEMKIVLSAHEVFTLVDMLEGAVAKTRNQGIELRKAVRRGRKVDAKEKKAKR